MKSSGQKYLGSDPALYAREVLKKCRCKEPPICQETVADYLDLEVKEVGSSEVDGYSSSIPERQGLTQIIKTACAWLQRKPNGKSRIWVHRDTRLERKRLSVFHECGHAILPWHEEFDYLCSENDIDPTVRSRIEREAFGCGSEFLMPKPMFVEDALSMETSFLAIEQLGHRYVASTEATAIRYAYVHPGLCGIVMIERAENQRPKPVVQDPTPPGQLLLPIRVPLRPLVVADDKRYPLRVRYFVKSHRFPKYIRPGTGIEEGNPVFEAWASGSRVQREIPASVFGSSAKWAYNTECIPLGKSGMILVLLWLPDHQLRLDFKDGVIL